MFAAYFAHKLNIPLAASWHTNVHEYAARRLPAFFRQLSQPVESTTLDLSTRFYSLAKVLFAPNQDLCTMLANSTGRPVHLMQRGVNTTLFSPEHRTRPLDARPFTLGYVGRLSPEKNVALLPAIQQELSRHSIDATFIIIGHGSEERALQQRDCPPQSFPAFSVAKPSPAPTQTWISSSSPRTQTPSATSSWRRSRAVFPPSLRRTADRCTIVEDGKTGVIAEDNQFASAISGILGDSKSVSSALRMASREYALTCTWDAVFDRVYSAYETILSAG